MNGQHNSAGPSTPCATSVDAHAQWNQTISVSETEQIQSAGAAPSAAAPQTLFGNYATSPASSTPANISRHLYEVGFLQGHWSDVSLHVTSITGFRRTFKLHALVIVRSPFLSRLLHVSPSPEIVLPVEDGNVTEEAIAIALGHLYGAPSHVSVTPRNARNVLAAAFFLQLEDLCQLSLEISKSSISRENILDHVTFTHVPHPPAPAFFAAAPGPSKAAGAEESSRYGPYSKILAEAVSDFLVSELPSLLGAFGTRATAPQVAMTGEQANGFQLPAPSSGSTATQGAGTDELLQIYAQLDFTLFQHVIQSSELPVHSDQERFNFAKRCIAHRKKRFGTESGEETVVLAFGGKSASNVHVTRKPRRGKSLMKVGDWQS